MCMPKPPFCLVVEERALSHFAEKKAGYLARVKAAALKEANNRGWSVESDKRLYCRIYYFHREPRTTDTDNFSKPILDALSGIVFRDDSQVVLRVAAKVDIYGGYTIQGPGNIPLNWYYTLISKLSDPKVTDLIYIEVGELDTLRPVLGGDTL